MLAHLLQQRQKDLLQLNHASTADIKETQPEGLKENQPIPPKAGALKRPAMAQKEKKKTDGITNFMKTAKTQEAKTQEAKPQDTPYNEVAELQNAPIYGPPTEKEHWEAIRQAAWKAQAEVKAKHQADEANLPAKAEYWAPLKAWLKEHHPAVMEGYEAIKNDSKILLAEERWHYRERQMQPLLNVWCATDPIGIKFQEQHNRRMSASHVLDEQRDNALKTITKELNEAIMRLQAIAEEERRIKREADFERAMKEQQEAKEELLMEEIGLELLRELDTSHPDLDLEAFDAFSNTKSSCRINMNYVLYGPTGLCKSRVMAHAALQTVKWCCDCAWISNSSFAALVTACGPDASSAQRKEARAELKRLAEVEFLFFDDLGAVRFTESRIEHFYTLMHARYKENLTTYFTTNYDRAGIEKMLAVNSTAAEREIAGRIIRRMIGTAAEPRAHLIAFKRRKAPAAKGGKAAPVC